MIPSLDAAASAMDAWRTWSSGDVGNRDVAILDSEFPSLFSFSFTDDDNNDDDDDDDDGL